ncbi:MAG: DNA-binding protein [Candidatus Lokiarchaeota archaeon]|nr:DNA-binding protein [Candidatus Lokiarchaeota archaeon]MBD3199941.1 DNA-binding protein [Candidatus Lokiarchaeota archaeon]
MSEEEKLEDIRKKKLEQLKQQAMQKQMAEEQQQAFEQQKYQIMRKILSQEGRQRLENIRMVKPQFAEQIELQLIQLFRSGRLKNQLSDNQFKKLLQQITKSNKKKDFKIKKL